ncbi:sulfite exporter TauE/SafE family protein [Marinobacteraceae bacterium S3BR75-40.1]
MTIMTALGLYVLLGAFAGTLAGLFGIGGGLIIVPVLMFSFELQGFEAVNLAHLAVGTSLATIVFTSLSSIRAHHLKQSVRWELFKPMALGIVFGAALGAWTASLLSSQGLENLIGIFAIVVAVKMLMGVDPKPGRDVPGAAGLVGVGGGIGWGSAIFGIGGGTLTVPFLSWCNVRMQQAVGTSAACGLPIALAGALSNVAVGWGEAGLPAWSAGFVYLPALAGIVVTSVPFAKVGAWLAHRLSPKLLKRIFAVVLIVVGLRFILS